MVSSSTDDGDVDVVVVVVVVGGRGGVGARVGEVERSIGSNIDNEAGSVIFHNGANSGVGWLSETHPKTVSGSSSSSLFKYE